MNYEEVFQGVEVKKVFARLQDLAIGWSMFMGQEETSRVGEEDSTSQLINLYSARFLTIMTENI